MISVYGIWCLISGASFVKERTGFITLIMTSAHNPFWEQGLEGFFQKQEIPAIAMQTGIFYYYIDDLERAEAYLLEALTKSQRRYYEVYYKKKMMPEASLCYRIVLKEDPENRIARERISE